MKEFFRKVRYMFFGSSDEFMLLNDEIQRLEAMIVKNHFEFLAEKRKDKGILVAKKPVRHIIKKETTAKK